MSFRATNQPASRRDVSHRLHQKFRTMFRIRATWTDCVGVAIKYRHMFSAASSRHRRNRRQTLGLPSLELTHIFTMSARVGSEWRLRLTCVVAWGGVCGVGSGGGEACGWQGGLERLSMSVEGRSSMAGVPSHTEGISGMESGGEYSHMGCGRVGGRELWQV